MKKLSHILTIFFIAIGLALGTSSCLVVEDVHHDHGNHAGWYKNTHNPHHPFSDNPGHSKHKGKGKH